MNMDRLTALLPVAIGVGATIVTLYQWVGIWQVWAGIFFLLGLSTSLLFWMTSKRSIVSKEQQMAATGTQGNFCYLVPIPIGRANSVFDWQMMILNSGSVPLRNVNIQIRKHRASATSGELIQHFLHPVRRVHISILYGRISPSDGGIFPLNFMLNPDDYFIDIQTPTRTCYQKLKPLKEGGYDITVVDRGTGEKLYPPEIKPQKQARELKQDLLRWFGIR